MEETILTVDQVAEMLKLHPFTVLKFIKQGRLRAAKLGRVYRLRRKDVEAFIDNLVEPGREIEAPGESKPKKAFRKKKSDQPENNTFSSEFSADTSLTGVPTEDSPRKASENGKKRPDHRDPNSPDHYVIDFTF